MERRQNSRCGASEPRIEDLLEDPVLLAVLRGDQVSRDELLAVIAGARSRLGSGGEAR
jgi:hypothetical protein